MLSVLENPTKYVADKRYGEIIKQIAIDELCKNKQYCQTGGDDLKQKLAETMATVHKLTEKIQQIESAYIALHNKTVGILNTINIKSTDEELTKLNEILQNKFFVH
jgi:hypothetical protein